MSLLLCKREPVRMPLYIEVLGIHIYSSQELCYVIIHHPLLVMDEFVDDGLIEFVRRELGMEALAGRMQALFDERVRPEEVLLLFLSGCDYCLEREIRQFEVAAASYRTMHPAEYEKARADYMFRQNQYGRAASRYEKLMEYPKDAKVTDTFLAGVSESLGASYAQMFAFTKALAAYERAYEVLGEERLLKRIYFLTCFAPELEVSAAVKSHFSPEKKKDWDEAVDQARFNAQQDEQVRALRALFKKDPLKRLEEAAGMVTAWKQEYRKMV